VWGGGGGGFRSPTGTRPSAAFTVSAASPSIRARPLVVEAVKKLIHAVQSCTQFDWQPDRRFILFVARFQDLTNHHRVNLAIFAGPHQRVQWRCRDPHACRIHATCQIRPCQYNIRPGRSARLEFIANTSARRAPLALPIRAASDGAPRGQRTRLILGAMIARLLRRPQFLLPAND